MKKNINIRELRQEIMADMLQTCAEISGNGLPHVAENMKDLVCAINVNNPDTSALCRKIAGCYDRKDTLGLVRTIKAPYRGIEKQLDELNQYARELYKTNIQEARSDRF